MKYDIEKHNLYWIIGGPWYNTYICEKLHGTVFDNYIRNTRTDRYKLMCSIGAHEKNQPSIINNGRSVGGNELPKMQQQNISFTNCNFLFH